MNISPPPTYQKTSVRDYHRLGLFAQTQYLENPLRMAKVRPRSEYSADGSSAGTKP